jgi:hypothetical protein
MTPSQRQSQPGLRATNLPSSRHCCRHLNRDGAWVLVDVQDCDNLSLPGHGAAGLHPVDFCVSGDG